MIEWVEYIHRKAELARVEEVRGGGWMRWFRIPAPSAGYRIYARFTPIRLCAAVRLCGRSRGVLYLCVISEHARVSSVFVCSWLCYLCMLLWRQFRERERQRQGAKHCKRALLWRVERKLCRTFNCLLSLTHCRRSLMHAQTFRNHRVQLSIHQYIFGIVAICIRISCVFQLLLRSFEVSPACAFR